jgi:ABC-type transport system involved in multi-copper enzyme maturation permease subunit
MKAIAAIAFGTVKELMRKKDFFVLLIFMLVMLGFLTAQSFFNIEGVARYVKDVGYSLVMLFSLIIAITFSARQFPVEIESRTIYPLLAKPLSRFTIVLGKFWGSVLISAISFSFYYAVYIAFYILEAGPGSLMLLAQGYLFGVFFLCLVCSLAIFFSNFMTLSANVTLSFLIYFMITGFSDSLREAVTFSKGMASACMGVLYYLVPHFDFFDLRVRITHEWDPLPVWVVFAVALYAVFYSCILLYISGKLFERKTF